MALKVHPRPAGRKRAKQDRLSPAERRAREVEREKVWREQWTAWAQAFGEGMLADEVRALLGRADHAWGDRGDSVAVGAQCNRCERSWRGWFRRNGTYGRTLDLAEIVVRVRVPRVRCACGGGVDVSFSLFRPYQRISAEMAQRVREGIALSLTLAQVGKLRRPANGGALAKSSLNARVHAIAPLVAAFHQAPLERIPPVVLLDGVWTKMLVPTGERFVDARQRERPRMRRQKVGLLVGHLPSDLPLW
ncbi:MAG: transposase [Actinomycetota bacterium]|nr:transposase [Actinomycetota bacterium]